MKTEEMIAIGVVLPVLLCIVLGIAIFARKAKAVQGNMVKRNIALIKEIVGNDIAYVDKGKLPFHIVGEDPSLHAKYANSCICRDMLQGKYRGCDYIVTNMETTRSEGYGQLSHAVFAGFYIFLNVRLKTITPMYACDKEFWKDFNVKESLHFKVGKKELYEGQGYAAHNNVKLLLTREDWKRNGVSSTLLSLFQAFFQQNQHSISFFVYSDGKLGIAIRNYKLFNFSQGKLPELKDSASESNQVRAIVQKDARVIKHYLERIHVIMKQLP